jgi:UDP-glucose 4-epimerase
MAGRAGQQTPGATHLIKVAAETVVGLRPELVIFGDDYSTPDGTCVRDYIHVGDLADAHLHALRYLEKGGESLTLNCGYGKGYSVKEVLTAVERATGAKLPMRMGPRRLGDPAALVAANDRIRAALPWQPRYADLDVIVNSALDWERRLLANRGTVAAA